MKIILKQDYEKLGKEGDVVNVKDGFAVNYLIPNHIAMKANDGNVRVLDELKKQQSKKILAMTHDAERLAGAISGTEISIHKLAGEEGKLYGSVTSQEICDELAKQGVTIDKKQIELHEHIKELGDFTVEIKLFKNIKATLKVKIEKQEA